MTLCRNRPVIVLSPPRSGSSFITQLLMNNGFTGLTIKSPIEMSSSRFNPDGYFENTWLALLNDQLIRLNWGKKSSFLHISKKSDSDEHDCEKYFYDLTPNLIDLPKDYIQNVKYYTGHDWDIWGLTRMWPGGKWHRAYSLSSIADYSGIINAVKHLEYAFAVAKKNRVPLLVKDPRLALTLKLLDVEADVIVLQREPEKVKLSMQDHYGFRLFSDQCFEGYDWVSNHFNYKVAYQTFTEYWERYYRAIDEATEGREQIRIAIDFLQPGSESWTNLEDFLGVELNAQQ